ncbi:MAG TPA: hypothetical protein VLZ74_14415 [Methylocella sp.]|nr:hypothetical protein [Methylocella sp.]
MTAVFGPKSPEVQVLYDPDIVFQSLKVATKSLEIATKAGRRNFWRDFQQDEGYPIIDAINDRVTVCLARFLRLINKQPQAAALDGTEMRIQGRFRSPEVNRASGILV